MKMALNESVYELAATMMHAGHRLYVVGGAVRDFVMGRNPKDIDLATDAMPEEIMAILSAAGYKFKAHGEAFGVIVAYTNDNPEGYEIATFRQDVSTGRKPEVKLGVTIEEDVVRRDFTINALFYDIWNNKVVDLVGGIDDIKNGIIRAVGNPYDRFADDRLRILRAVRFAARYNFAIEWETACAIFTTSLDGISSERIMMETANGIRTESSDGLFMRTAHQLGMLGMMFPGLNVDGPLLGGSLHLNLAGVLRNNSNLRNSLVQLSWPIDVARAVEFLVSSVDFSGSGVVKTHAAMRLAGVNAPEMIAMGMNVDVANALELFERSVDGNDVMAEGFSGQQIGAEIERREAEHFNNLVLVLRNI